MVTSIEKLAKLRADMQTFEKPKNARHYADEILVLRSKEERAAALEKVPDEFRHTVKFYIADYFAKRHKRPLPDLKEK